MTSPLVHLDHLHKAFGQQPVLRGVHWTIAPGAIVGLLGRNGAGKSTLLECLLGLREADRGACTLLGEPVTALSDTARAAIGYVPQKSELFEWMTPYQMLDYFKALYPRWNGATQRCMPVPGCRWKPWAWKTCSWR
jgi:ABC-2 type transport system ATP-binding protein